MQSVPPLGSQPTFFCSPIVASQPSHPTLQPHLDPPTPPHPPGARPHVVQRREALFPGHCFEHYSPTLIAGGGGADAVDFRMPFTLKLRPASFTMAKLPPSLPHKSVGRRLGGVQAGKWDPAGGISLASCFVLLVDTPNAIVCRSSGVPLHTHSAISPLGRQQLDWPRGSSTKALGAQGEDQVAAEHPHHRRPRRRAGVHPPPRGGGGTLHLIPPSHVSPRPETQTPSARVRSHRKAFPDARPLFPRVAASHTLDSSLPGCFHLMPLPPERFRSVRSSLPRVWNTPRRQSFRAQLPSGHTSHITSHKLPATLLPIPAAGRRPGDPECLRSTFHLNLTDLYDLCVDGVYTFRQSLRSNLHLTFSCERCATARPPVIRSYSSSVQSAFTG